MIAAHARVVMVEGASVASFGRSLASLVNRVMGIVRSVVVASLRRAAERRVGPLMRRQVEQRTRLVNLGRRALRRSVVGVRGASGLDRRKRSEKHALSSRNRTANHLRKLKARQRAARRRKRSVGVVGVAVVGVNLGVGQVEQMVDLVAVQVVGTDFERWGDPLRIVGR